MVDISDVIKKSMSAGIGVISFTAEKAQEFVSEMVERGDMSREQGASMAKELVKRGEEARAQLREIIKTEVAKVISEANIPSKDEINRIEEKIDRVLLAVARERAEATEPGKAPPEML